VHPAPDESCYFPSNCENPHAYNSDCYYGMVDCYGASLFNPGTCGYTLLQSLSDSQCVETCSYDSTQPSGRQYKHCVPSNIKCTSNGWDCDISCDYVQCCQDSNCPSKSGTTLIGCQNHYCAYKEIKCNDEIDNDGDSFVDQCDSDCTGASFCSNDKKSIVYILGGSSSISCDGDCKANGYTKGTYDPNCKKCMCYKDCGEGYVCEEGNTQTGAIGQPNCVQSTTPCTSDSHCPPPSSSGDTCTYYKCENGECVEHTDTNKPSTYYTNAYGNICYYNCNVECVNGEGWKRSGCSSCSLLTATDSDNGKNYNTKGTCRDNPTCTENGCEYKNSHTDYCEDSNTLVEYYTYSGSCYSETHNCGSGYICLYGACRQCKKDGEQASSVSECCSHYASGNTCYFSPTLEENTITDTGTCSCTCIQEDPDGGCIREVCTCSCGGSCSEDGASCTCKKTTNYCSFSQDTNKQCDQSVCTDSGWDNSNCDITPPSTTISPNGKDWTNSGVSFTLSCSDSGSGCSETKYSIIDSSQSCPSYNSLSNTGTSGTVSCPNGQTCEKVVCYASKDNAGNTESVKRSNTFKIDKSPPSTSDSIENPSSNNYKITLSCSDSGSGCSETKYCIDDSNNCQPNNIYSSEISKQCTSCCYIRYYSIDKAGNVEDVKSDSFGSTCNCIHSNPTVTIIPSSQTGNPGDTKTYTITVKNNDQNCGSETFELVQTCPSGWNCALSTVYLSISSGSTSTANIDVTPPSTAADGTYTFSVKATNLNYNSYYSTGSANYVVTTTQCTDTDNGLDYTTQGTVTDSSGSYTDYCSSNTQLVEYYCSNGQHAYTYYDCSNLGSNYICQNGACIQQPTPPPCTSNSDCPSPSSSGDTCTYYTCENGQCVEHTDNNNPSCNPYSIGDTCYYNGYSTCTDSGWSVCLYSSQDTNKQCDQSVCTNNGWDNSKCGESSCTSDSDCEPPNYYCGGWKCINGQCVYNDAWECGTHTSGDTCYYNGVCTSVYRYGQNYYECVYQQDNNKPDCSSQHPPYTTVDSSGNEICNYYIPHCGDNGWECELVSSSGKKCENSTCTANGWDNSKCCQQKDELCDVTSDCCSYYEGDYYVYNSAIGTYVYRGKACFYNPSCASTRTPSGIFVKKCSYSGIDMKNTHRNYYNDSTTCYYNCDLKCTDTGYKLVNCYKDNTKVCSQSVCTANGWDNSGCSGTWIQISPKYVSPGENVTITVHWSSNSYDKSHNVKLKLYIDGNLWKGNDCVFSDKWISDMGYDSSQMSYWGMCGSSSFKWCKDDSGYYHHEEDGWPMKIKPETGQGTMVFVCRIPSNLSGGAHTITVTPFIESKLIVLSPMTAKIYVVTESQTTKTPLKDLFLKIMNFFNQIFH